MQPGQSGKKTPKAPATTYAARRRHQQRSKPKKVDIVGQAPLTVYAKLYEGPVTEIGTVWRALWRAVVERGLAEKITLAVGAARDAPDANGNIAYRAGVALCEPLTKTGDFEVLQIEGGRYASYRLIGPYSGIADAFPRLFGEWLPASGYEADDRYVLELYRNNPYETPESELVTDLLMPIRERDAES